MRNLLSLIIRETRELKSDFIKAKNGEFVGYFPGKGWK